MATSALRRFSFYRRLKLRRLSRFRKERAAERWELVKMMLANVGLITMTWAGIELILGTFLETIHGILPNPPFPELQRDISRKLKYLKAVEKIPEWSDADRDEMRRIRLEISRLNEHRKAIIHGNLIGRDVLDRQWEIFTAKADGQKLQRQFHPYPQERAMEILSEMSKLQADMAEFFGRVMGMGRPENVV